MYYSALTQNAQPRGFVALISAVIISTILLGLAVAIGSSTFFSRFDVLNSEYKRISLGLSEACVSAALGKIGNDYSYVGNETIPLGTQYNTSTSCTIGAITYVDDAVTHKRTYSIPTKANFLNAFSNVTVKAIGQDPAFAPVVPPPSCVITVNPTSVPAGQSGLKLQWNTSSNATSFSINQGVGSVALVSPVGGYAITTPGVGTVTYTGTATNAGGTNTCSATLTVTAPPPAPSCADSVMIFDRTGSMSGTDLGNERTAGNQLVSLYQGVASLPSIGAGSFGGLNGSAASIPSNGVLTNIYSSITSAISSITGSNSSVGSNLGAAISVADVELASARHDPLKQKVLIFVSDGLPNQPSTISSNTGTSSPTANVQNGTGDLWSNPTNAYTDSAGDASDTGGHRHRFYNFNFPTIPSGATISGITAGVDAWASAVSTPASATLPASSVGIFDDWTANTGTRVSAVNSNDGDTSYIDTSAAIETFDVTDAGIPAGSIINSVTITAVARGTAGGATLALVAENGGAPNIGTTNSLTTNYATYTRTMTTNVSGNPWTLAEVNAWTTRFGVRASNGAAAVRVTQFFVTVNYSPTANTGLKAPTQTGQNGLNQFQNGNRAFVSDNSYATDSTTGHVQGYSQFSLSVPGTATVVGLDVAVEAKSSDSSGCQVGAELSSNGTTFTTTGQAASLSSFDTVYTLGSANNLWGRTWSTTETNGTTFSVKLTNIDPGSSCSNGSTLSLDQIQARAYYTLPPVTTSALAPVALGGYAQWNANTGTDVSAVTGNDGDTSYIDTSTYTETYAMQNTAAPLGSTINSVTISAVARGTASGATLALVAENGGAPNAGTTNTLSTSYATYTRVMTTNPFTGNPWTLAEVNAWTTRFGVRASSGPSTARITQFSVTVEYQAAPVTSNCQLGVDLSWNGGTSWTTEKAVTLGGSESTFTLGNGSDRWGRTSWALSDFTNSNFRARVHDINPGSNCSASAVTHADWLRLNVTYTQPANSSQYATDAATTAKANGVNIFSIHFGDASGQNFMQSLSSASTIAPSSISTVSRASNTVTVTTSGVHHLVQNQRIVISGVTNTAFNGTFMITSVPSPTTFTYAQTASNANSSGGTVSPTNLFIAPASSAMSGIFQSIGYQICPAAASVCSNGIDDDSDGASDEQDPGCHSDNNAANLASYQQGGGSEWSTPNLPPAPPPPPPPPNISIGSWIEVP